MPYLHIENFEAGLDTRKTRYTAPPGTLRVLKNAHINRGKEIERRKAFAEIGTLPADTFGLHGVQDQLWTFGSVTTPATLPATVEYQQLVDPNGGNMTALLAAENFAGKIYAVAEFDNGYIQHFYDGAVVTDWNAVAQSVATARTVASALGARLDTDGTADVVVVGDTIILTGDPGTAFSVTTANTELTITETQAAVAAQPEVRATASFDITSGTAGQTFNTVDRVEIDGLDLMGDPVNHTGDNATTAQAVADRINSYTTEYEASASGATVTVTAPPGLGAAANGRVLSVDVSGDVTVGNLSDMSGGQDPVDPVPQISEISVDTFGVAVTYTVTLEGTDYKIVGESSGMATTVRAVKQKMYAVVGSLLYFSGFSGVNGDADPTQWSGGDTNETGEGFINLSTQYSGSEELTGLGVYQGRVAVFSRRAVQIWSVDPDPAQNILYQTLLNVGAIAPHSIIEYGDLDIFFLSETGIRSMRARDSSNLASADDVGVAIDAELADYVTGLSRDKVVGAKAVVEPADGRYLLAIGSRVYVFSNFPGSRISAWSTYDLGAEVADWAVAGSRLYARVGDSLRLYGGYSGQEYDTDETEVILPFLDASNPAGYKQIQGLDAGTDGTWKVEMASEPDQPDEYEEIAVITGSTYGSSQRVGMVGKSTHVSLRFTTSEAERAAIGNAIIHYRDLKAD